MTVTIDLNIALDAFLERGDFLEEASVLSLCDDKLIEGCFPSHGIPTIYYILTKQIGHEKAIEFVSKLIENIRIVPIDKRMLEKAFALNFPDFEDAIVAISAEESDQNTSLPVT